MNTEAVNALKLANSYLDEVVNLIPNPFEIEPGSVNEITKTIDLAGKQLDKAEKLDPAVSVTHEVRAGTTQLDVKTTRASIYLYKGLTVGFGKGEKTAGAKLIEQCIAMKGENHGTAEYDTHRTKDRCAIHAPAALRSTQGNLRSYQAEGENVCV